MTFKILCLDGGGMRGIISARILQEVEKEIKERKGLALHEYFDMIAGTSTGSILTAGIATKKTSQQLIDLYKTEGKYIFPPRKLAPFLQKIADFFSSSKYSNEGLINVLQNRIGNIQISQVKHPIILILGYDLLYRNTTFFTNFHPDQGLKWYDDTPLWEICVSSSSAPTYFPPYLLKVYNPEKFGDWNFPHIDGGVAANNPSLAAISLVLRISHNPDVPLEIKQEYKVDNLELEDISVLSISTGRGGEPYRYEEAKEWKSLDWAQKISDVFMEPTAEIAATICRQLLGGYDSKRYLRLEFELNERFKAKENETYKDTRELVPKEQRINRFTQKKLSEAIDDSSEQYIQDALEAATAFVETGCTYYNRALCGPLVKNAIADFLTNN
ncbi:patatin [[Phormidium ambiguum] IAM M-71]|uniref:Patatin n=1 Tax=[Phormidium ambiguum] IAM M-71 TaxID=454136 RepID=A0A1U7IG58_9CYAN|nr:patatin-like phospholipase family protein [Phormidium ambiguum]OKH35969.1 patatin [Phormidium ambiguum IAM M-71]